MTEWPMVTVSELEADDVLLVQDGNHGEYRPRPDEFVSDGTAFIRATELSDGVVDFAGAGRIDDVARNRVRKGIGASGDVLFSHKGTVGKLARVPLGAEDFVCSPQTTFWRTLDEDRLRRDYLYCFMRSRLFIDQWWVRKGETDMADYVSLTAQRQLRVMIPPVDVQRRIAEPITAMDDLIENNRRRIELLEQMAQAIYRQWFVHFRYPGHENVAPIDSPLGLIPEGWQVKSLATVAKLTMGQSPPSQYYNTRGVGKFFHQGVTDFGPHFPVNRKYCSSDGRSASAGDILISVRAPVGRLNIALDDMTIGRGLASARSRTDEQSLLFRALKDVVFAEEDAMGSGTIFRAIGKQELQRIQLVVPPRHIGTLAESQLANNSALLRALTLQGRTLGGIRDVLLPRLVTGQIDASSLDLDAVMDPEG